MSSPNSVFLYVVSALEENPDKCENFDSILKYVASAFLGSGCSVQGLEQKIEKALYTAIDLGLVVKTGKKYYFNVSRVSQLSNDTNENEDGMEAESQSAITATARKSRRSGKKTTRTKKRSRKVSKRRKKRNY